MNVAVASYSKLLFTATFCAYASGITQQANKKINIVYRQEKIIISNDGSKIENKDISHIFEPLYKADVSRNDTNSTGMGLAIVRNILDLHNYTCKVVQDEEVHFIIEMNK